MGILYARHFETREWNKRYLHHGLNPLGIESEHVEGGLKDSERKMEAESKRI